MQSTVSDAYVSDMNSRGCPALTITSTTTGHRVGIYAQDGLGFVLYDYTEMRRIGLCSFD